MRGIKNFIAFLEKERLGVITIFFWILFLGTVRMWTEVNLFGYHYHLIQYAHTVSFYICVFLTGILSLKLFAKEKIMKIANLSAFGFIIVLFPPLVDHFIFHYSTYTYIPKEKFLYGIFFLYNKIFPEVAGYGLMIEIILILISTTLYVFIKTNSAIRAIGNLIFLNFLIIYVSTPTVNPLLNSWEKGVLCQPVFLLRYIVLSIIFLLLIAIVIKKQLFISIIKSIGLLRTLHFAVMTLIGVFIVGHVSIDVGNLMDYSQVGNVGMLGLAIFSVMFIWQYAVMINNVYDVEIDKVTKKDRLLVQGYISPKTARKIAFILAFIGIALSAILSLWHFLLALLFLFLATIYSVPPLRLRDYPFSPLFIGAGSSIAFLMGCLTPSYIVADQSIIKVFPAISEKIYIVSLLIFITLSIGGMTKDIDDYYGDKKEGVRNIFTIYGIDRGINIVSALLAIAFLSPLLLFHAFIDALIFIISGIFAILSFRKIRRMWSTFPFYFFVLIYALLRWFSII